MKRFWAALRFLTVAPIPAGWCGGVDDLASSVVMFPLVGLLIGMAAAGVARGLGHVVASLPAAAIITIGLLGASGGLHLDGLSDTADGFLSSRPKERILEIMKDSHIGVMGVIAVVSVMILKIAALASLPGAIMWKTVLLMPLTGRCAMVMAMMVLPCARPEGGLGSLFTRRRPKLLALWALGFMILAAGLLLGIAGLVVAVSSVAVTGLFCVYSYRKIGGATGDVFGAACELAEAVPALVMVFWIGGTIKGGL